MGSVNIDMSEVVEFAASLGHVPQELARHATPALKRFAQDVKKDVQEDLRSSSNAGFRKIAHDVSYDDITPGVSGFETELGIDKGGPGSLGNLAVFGTSKGGGTHPHPADIAPWHMPAFEKAVAAAAAELLS